jgi:hypothetical protein
VLLAITGNSKNACLLKANVMRRLKKDMKQEVLRSSYQKQLLDGSEPYRISIKELSILVTDIIDSLEPMHQELSQMERYFEKNAG